MKTSSILWLLTLSLAGVVACATSSVTGEPEETATTAATASPTPTQIVWFPPTEAATRAPAPTAAPTEERKPGIGRLLVEDAMTSATHWEAATGGTAPVTVSERGLRVAAEPGRPPVVSLHRSAVFDNMYIEVTARPSLCRGQDAYGLVFRAPNEVAYYRLLAVCDGTVAAERVSLGTPRVLQPPTPTADVPVGAPGDVRLGIWASGSEMRFFLNDRFQFKVTDRNYLTGGIGVFVEAKGATPAVVTFSDLRVYELMATAPASTASP